MVKRRPLAPRRGDPRHVPEVPEAARPVVKEVETEEPLPEEIRKMLEAAYT